MRVNSDQARARIVAGQGPTDAELADFLREQLASATNRAQRRRWARLTPEKLRAAMIAAKSPSDETSAAGMRARERAVSRKVNAWRARG